MSRRHSVPRSRWAALHRSTITLALLALTIGSVPHLFGAGTGAGSGADLTADLAAPAASTSAPTPEPDPTTDATPARPVAQPAAQAAAAVTPVRRLPSGVAAAGPLFRGSSGNSHSCSASVLDAGDGVSLVITAAHCVSGSGAGIRFAPGYHDGTAPYGVWTSVAGFADAGWISAQDPRRDYALLAVAPRGGRPLSDVVAGYRLGAAPRTGSRVQVIGYPSGTGGSAVICTATVYGTSGFPSFDCPGFVGGTSGGSWTAAATDGGVPVLRGVIGGLHQGGCEPDTSYSPVLNDAARDLVARAAAAVRLGIAGDRLPAAGPDGC